MGELQAEPAHMEMSRKLQLLQDEPNHVNRASVRFRFGRSVG